MNKVCYAIGDFFGIIFNYVDAIGNSINYLYILIIFSCLVIWIVNMIRHRKDGEEHAAL